MRFTSLGLIGISLLIGCQQVHPPVIRNSAITTERPYWINEPPPDSQDFLYGIGEGKNRQLATQHALTDLSAKLGITVNSQFSSTLSVIDRGYELVERDSRQLIGTEIKAIEINQYQVVESYSPFPSKVYILLKTDKQKLFNAYLQSVAQDIKAYHANKSYRQRLSMFERYQLAAKEKNKLSTLYRKLLIAEVLNPKVSVQNYIRYEQQVLNDYQDLESALKFTVYAPGARNKAFAAPLRTMMAQESLIASDGRNNLKIKVVVSEQLSQAYGFYIGRYEVVLTVLEGQTQIGGNQFFLKGQGVQSYQAAQRQAIKKFDTTISSQKLWEVLGVKRN